MTHLQSCSGCSPLHFTGQCVILLKRMGLTSRSVCIGLHYQCNSFIPMIQPGISLQVSPSEKGTTLRSLMWTFELPFLPCFEIGVTFDGEALLCQYPQHVLLSSHPPPGEQHALLPPSTLHVIFIACSFSDVGAPSSSGLRLASPFCCPRPALFKLGV